MLDDMWEMIDRIWSRLIDKNVLYWVDSAWSQLRDCQQWQSSGHTSLSLSLREPFLFCVPIHSLKLSIVRASSGSVRRIWSLGEKLELGSDLLEAELVVEHSVWLHFFFCGGAISRFEGRWNQTMGSSPDEESAIKQFESLIEAGQPSRLSSIWWCSLMSAVLTLLVLVCMFCCCALRDAVDEPLKNVYEVSLMILADSFVCSSLEYYSFSGPFPVRCYWFTKIYNSLLFHVFVVFVFLWSCYLRLLVQTQLYVRPNTSLLITLTGEQLHNSSVGDPATLCALRLLD